MTGLIRRLLGRKDLIPREGILQLKALDKELVPAELGRILHELCVLRAADFVKGELSRADSPFRGLREDSLFHEIMMMNLWLLDAAFEGRRKKVMEAVRGIYLAHFNLRDDSGQTTEAINVRSQAYSRNWNDHTGHQHEFGQRAGEFIFGTGAKFPVDQVGFWIITYADETLKRFAGIRKQLRKAGIRG